MTSPFRKVSWWRQRRRKEEDLRDELQFHLEEEAAERATDGLSNDEARRLAHRDLGNITLVREDTRTLWSWVIVEQLGQDIRYGVRAMLKNRVFAAMAALSLALGIGANTAIYSLMDAILLRSLPVADPASLVSPAWRSQPVTSGNGSGFVMHGGSGHTYPSETGMTGAIFPFPAFERLREASAPVLSSLFAFHPAGSLNVLVEDRAELGAGEFVSGGYFAGLGVTPAEGRLILDNDDREGAAPVAVLSLSYARRRFGDAAAAAGQPIRINNVAFTVIGVTPAGFFGVDPGAAPDVYIPLHSTLLSEAEGPRALTDLNFYWLDMMGRLKPGVGRAEAEAALAAPFTQWAATTATTDRERANLPVLRLDDGTGGLDTLRREYSTALYVLLGMVGLILAIACANTANLLLARSAARRREIAVRLSLGAGRFRLVRQLLTESVLLASLSGAFGVVIAIGGVRVLTELLANGDEGFIVHAELNWHVLAATIALSLLCGLLFGLAPALQSTRPGLMPDLRDRSVTKPQMRVRHGIPRLSLTQTLVAAQVAISLVLLVGAGLFVRTLSNLQSIALGFNRDGVLLFDVNASQAGYAGSATADFYGDLRRRLEAIGGVRDVTLSHASLVRAARSHPISVDGKDARGTRILMTGADFFSTMQIPLMSGRPIDDGDRQGAAPVVVISDLFARTYFGDENPIGRHLEIGGSLRTNGVPMNLEIVGVAATARYGRLKDQVPPVVYVPYAQIPASQLNRMTYAIRTDGSPLAYTSLVRQVVQQADARVPVANVRTLDADIDQTVNQEIVFARLCSAFAVLALVIASVGLYATMAYAVARRTNEIGLRMALGAARAGVIWMILREVGVLAVIGLAAGIPTALATSRYLESLLFEMKANDPWALTFAIVTLLGAALLAGFGPARRASRVDPMIALRHE